MVFANGAALCSAVTSVALAAAVPVAVASSPSLWNCPWREAGPTRMGANIGWPNSSSDRSSAFVLTIMRARNVIRSRAERSPPAMRWKARSLSERRAISSNSGTLANSSMGVMRPGASPTSSGAWAARRQGDDATRLARP